MKKIFIASSNEARKQAEKMEEVLAGVDGVEPYPWYRQFGVNEISFIKIGKIADRVAGAIFLATPDDESIIREQSLRVPRANVLFEYGYLTARLTSTRVALCCYDSTTLPSDLAGLTFVPMGLFEPDCAISEQTRTTIQTWAAELPALQLGTSPTVQVHGYSGVWRAEVVFSRWRKLDILPGETVAANATVTLHIPADGRGGTGSLHARLIVNIRGCYAQFDLCDIVLDARVLDNGSLKMRSRMHTRIMLGEPSCKPPQEDGFEAGLRGAHEFEWLLHTTKNEDELRGDYKTTVGEEVYSVASLKFHRA